MGLLARNLKDIFDNGYFTLSLIFLSLGASLVSMFFFPPNVSSSLLIENFRVICFASGACAISIGMLFGYVGFSIDKRPKVKVIVKRVYFVALISCLGGISNYFINYTI